MIIPVDKEKILNEFKEKYVYKKFQEEVPKIYERFNSNKEDIKQEINDNFKKVCAYAIELQEKALKDEIRYIHISYLRTGVIENKGIYRIDLYDDKWFVDKEECSINVDLDFIFVSLFSHISELEEHRKEYSRNITEMDIEKIKLSEGDKYHELTLEILKSMIDDFVECDEYKAMKKHDEIMILAGEYRDESTILFESKSKDI